MPMVLRSCAVTLLFRPGAAKECRQLIASGHWYDLSTITSNDARYLRRFAGHVETGAASITDPAIAVTPMRKPRASN